jgi:hypothetical protein
MESEILNVVKLSKDAVSQVTNTSRGLSVQVKNTPAKDENNVSARYSYTILEKKPNVETVSYDKPADISGFIGTIKSGVLAQGGTFTGDEKQGTFTQKGLSGTYKVTDKEVVFSFEQGQNETSATRGMGAAYSFAFSKPNDINKSLTTVQSEVKKNSGTFSGNEQEGSFAVSGIAGGYKIGDNVSVSIYEKPWVIPNSLIEKEVKNYFLGK